MSGVSLTISFHGWQGSRKQFRVYENKYVAAHQIAEMLGIGQQKLTSKATPVKKTYRDTNITKNYITLEQLETYLKSIWKVDAAKQAMQEIRSNLEVALRKKSAAAAAPARKRVSFEGKKDDDEEEKKVPAKKHAVEKDELKGYSASSSSSSSSNPPPRHGGGLEALVPPTAALRAAVGVGESVFTEPPSWWSAYESKIIGFFSPYAVTDMMESPEFKEFCMERIKKEVDEELAKISSKLIDELKPLAKTALRQELQESVLKEVEKKRHEIRHAPFDLNDVIALAQKK